MISSRRVGQPSNDACCRSDDGTKALILVAKADAGPHRGAPPSRGTRAEGCGGGVGGIEEDGAGDVQ
jgi:hypothetical protein